MKMTLMGTGTSHGIPVVACSCPVCTSNDPRDKRYRCSAYIENEDSHKDGEKSSTTNIVIDTGPEFRIQALENKIKRLDGVLLTHSHADHCHGLDDLRIFSFKKPPKMALSSDENSALSHNDAIALAASENSVRETPGSGLPIYAPSSTIESLVFRFAYIFNTVVSGGGIPKLNLIPADENSCSNPVKIGSVEAVPVPMIHGSMVDYGWVLHSKEKSSDGKFHSIAYLTDCNLISDESIEIVKTSSGVLEHLVIDALRKRPHPTHCNFDKALEYADRIGAKHTWLTHICHDNSHVQIQEYIDENLGKYKNLKRIVGQGGSVSPAYDGLVLEAF
ncbi:MAG: MBL fold metallo-hydrolase [Treponema sp.]|nr:MBL fold metallo-hydrolase [Treponema sp.]